MNLGDKNSDGGFDLLAAALAILACLDCGGADLAVAATRKNCFEEWPDTCCCWKSAECRW